MTVAGSRPASTAGERPRRARRGGAAAFAVARAISASDGSNGVTSVTLSRPCRSRRGRRGRGRARSGRPRAAASRRRSPSRTRAARPGASRSSSVANITSSRARLDLLRRRDHPADLHPLAVAALGDLGAAASRPSPAAPRARRLSGCSVMKRPMDSFSIASSSAVELLGRDRRMGRAGERRARRRPRRRSRRGRRSRPGRSARRAAPSGPPPAPPRAPRACPCAVAPVEPNAPHLISASIAFLLTARPSTRSQKSHSDVNAPSSSRAALIASTAA